MLRRTGLIGLLWILLAGCSGPSAYTCPDPVGKIIQDDCQVYRTRYEALKVELGASIGPLGVKTSLGQGSLRDPSELLQVLAHRTHALCRDFNACRVPPLEYRQRREQTDRIFTAVSTIQEQLKGQLDAESKAKLVRELVRVLGEDTGSSHPPPPAASGSLPPPTERPRRAYYSSSVPWFGTRLLPPQPRAPEGFPQLAGARFSLAHVFRQESPYGTTGYRPSVNLWLLGTSAADDLVSVDWGGRSTDCPIGRGQVNGLAKVRCEAPRTLSLTGATFTIKVTYRRGLDGKSALIGQRTVPVLSRQDEDARPGSLTYGLDHDAEAREGRLVFRPLGGGLPPDLEQPSLLVVLKLRKYLPATARCWVNGKLATPGLTTSRYGGQEGWFQDRPRWKRVGPGSSEGVADFKVEWWRYDFPLPFVVSPGGAPVPEGLRLWPLAGDWRCQVSVEGEPVRELTFRVGSDGRPAAHPGQLQRPDPGWLLQTRLLKSPFEASPP